MRRLAKPFMVGSQAIAAGPPSGWKSGGVAAVPPAAVPPAAPLVAVPALAALPV